MNKKEKSARAKPIADGAEKFLGRRREILRTRRRNSLNGSGKSFEYVRNPYGLRIKVCCASCQWKQLTESLVTRKCRRLKKRVKPRHCCGFWEMSDGLRELRIKKAAIKREQNGACSNYAERKQARTKFN